MVTDESLPVFVTTFVNKELFDPLLDAPVSILFSFLQDTNKSVNTVNTVNILFIGKLLNGGYNSNSVLTGSFPNRSNSGFSSSSFTRTRKETDSRPSMIR